MLRPIALLVLLAAAPAAAQERGSIETRLLDDHRDGTALAYGLSLGFAAAAGIGYGLAFETEGPAYTAGLVLAPMFTGLTVVTFFIAVGMDIGATVWSNAPAGRAGRPDRARLSTAITAAYAACPISIAVGAGLIGLGAANRAGFEGMVAGYTVMGLGVLSFLVGIGLDIAAGRWAPAQFIVSPSQDGLYVGTQFGF